MSVRIPWRKLVFLCALLSLTGCFWDEPLSDAINEYRDRLSRVLDTDVPALPDIVPLNYPPGGEMRQPVAALNINLRDFYALKNCALYTLVAERNTSVGKTQQPSQRLAYESAFLQAIDACIETVEDQSPALAVTLTDIKQVKQQQYQQVWANLIQGSDALRYALSMPQSLLKQAGNRDARGAVTALHYLNKRALPDAFSATELEEALKQNASARLPAKIWYTQRYLTQTLNTLSTAIAPALEAVSCPDGRASDQAKILRNVFYLFFIEQIQPVGSKLNELHYQLLPVFRAWLAAPILSAPFKAYIQRHAVEEFGDYQSAVKQHVTLWQSFLGRCNLSPQAPQR